MASLFVRFYEAIIRVGESLQSLLLLAMRLYWGFQFYLGGVGKFHSHPKIVQYFQSLNIPFAEANAYLVATVETVGGLLLIAGFASRLVSIPLTVLLCTAYATAHREQLLHLFQDPEAFIRQSPFNFLVMCLVVFCFGPGKYSIDYLLQQKRSHSGK